MIADFALEIQNSNASLEALVKEKSSWTHHWKDSDLALELEPSAKRARGKDESQVMAKPMTEEVIKMVHNNAGLLRSLQSQLDRKDRNQPTSAPGAPSKTKDKGGNPKGAGKTDNNRSAKKRANRWKNKRQ